MEQLPEEKKIPEETGWFSRLLSSLGVEEKRSKIALFSVVTIVLFSAYTSFSLMPPFGFPENKIITIKSGATLIEVSTILSKENLIRSKVSFEFCAKLVGGTKPVSAGQYLFRQPASACTIATRLARGISGIPAIHVTIPEGMSNKEIVSILEKSIPKFDSTFFLEHARAQEGFLFPDTYFLPENITAQGVETMMLANFSKKIEPWNGAIETSKHSLRDIIIMASILEKEATTEEDKALVSGVLWNRVAKGMPLQVDATFMYLIGKKSNELTSADLKIKSMYNTYINKGLPSGPIGNPGIVAIRAAIHPTATPYMYYLSDKDGLMHYAKTFEEHKANKKKYLQ